jgi:ATP-dependent helicase HepA
MQLNSLVISSDNQLGIGKLVALENSQAIVEYFCSVAKRFTEVLPLTSLHWAKLSLQTRCYIYQPKNETWIIGRIYEWDEENKLYQIDLPDSQTTCAPETVIYVRCFMAVDDPIDILAIKAHETPYFHSLRYRLVANLNQQRSISQGMTGLLSANIKLYPQQVAALRQILTSPITRYLIADTIAQDRETVAAVVLRQFLLDNPQLHALVIVPAYSVEHWQKQLEQKIYLSDFEERVIIQSLEEQKIPSSCGFLLIDEAHYVAAMATVRNLVTQDYFERFKRLAGRCSGLILLSSLSLLHNEAVYWAMLHLLDPDNYSLEGLDDWQESLKQRQEIGKLLCQFNADDTVYLANLKSLGVPEHLSLDNIKNIYRLHPRLLRINTPSLSTETQAEALPRLEYDLDERAYDILAQLEAWRNLATEEKYAEIFALFYQGSSTWLGILKQLVIARKTGKIANELTEDFPEKTLKKLVETEKFNQEEAILEQILNILETPSEDRDRLQLLKILILYHLAETLDLQSFRSNLEKLNARICMRIQRPFTTDKLPKFIIFTSFSQSARVIREMLASSFGEDTVVSCCGVNSRELVEKNLNHFRTAGKCLFLVCDRSGEVGKNLNFVTGVIHFDLPFSAHGLAQRLNRVRNPENQKIPPTWILAGLDGEESLEAAWYQIFSEGYQIFTRSEQTLNHYLETKLLQLQTLLRQKGAQGIREIILQLRQEIEEEELQINAQNIFETLDITDANNQQKFQELVEHDAQTQNIEKAVEGWLCNVLKFSRKYSEKFYDLRSYQLTKRTLIPWHELKTFFASSGFPAGVYSREQANEYPGVHLYRLGEKLLDHLYNYLQWDDRGQTFALGRVEEGVEWAGLRFDYFLEADYTYLQPLLEKPHLNPYAIKRQIEQLFPPRLQTIFLDLNFQPVLDVHLYKILKKPYNKSTDCSLAKSRLSVLDEFIEPQQWANFCQKARQRSEDWLRNSPEFLTLCQTQKAQAEVKFKEQKPLLRNILKSLEYPSLKLDAVGFIVISERLSFD